LSKIIITGSSGFIGSALISKLKKENIAYIGLSRKNINGLTKISSYADFSGDNNSILVHLAQPNNTKIESYVEEVQLFESLVSSNWEHIIYISSATVYGDQIETPRKPEEEIFEYNNYTAVKLKCEKITLNKRGTCLRFSNIFGPNMSKENVISEILFQIFNSDKIVVKNIHPIRDFLWIDDAVSAIIQTIKIKPSGIINVGSGVGISIEELAKNIIHINNKPNKFLSPKNFEKRKSVLILNIDKTKKILKWEPKTTIIDGLSKLIKLNNV
jgi:UDP-glucose 4-epimerase